MYHNEHRLDYLLFLGARCDSAEPAAVLAALLELLLRSTFDAALAALVPVLRCFFICIPT